MQGEPAELALVPVLSFWGAVVGCPHLPSLLLAAPTLLPSSPHLIPQTPLSLTGPHPVPGDYPVARCPNWAFEDWLCSADWGLSGNSLVRSAAAADLANPGALPTSLHPPPLPLQPVATTPPESLLTKTADRESQRGDLSLAGASALPQGLT